MKKEIQSINHMTLEEIAKFLNSYVQKSNKVKAIVSRNKGGRKESIFNESEVASEANHAIYRVVKKVEEYREARNLKGYQEKRQFEDVPLLIKYFDQALDHAMKDLNNKGSALMRSRYSEVLHSINEVSLEELHGSWAEVQEREKSDILKDTEQKLREVLVEENTFVVDQIIKGFLLLFKERVQTEKEFSKELSISPEDALALKERIFRLLGQFCQDQMSDLIKLVRDNKTYWEVGRDEAKASNKTEVRIDTTLTPQDMNCEVVSVAHMKKKDGKVNLEISVQIVRENGAQKEVVETIEAVSVACATFEEAMTEKTKYALRVKQAERKAQLMAKERKEKAREIFGADVAA